MDQIHRSKKNHSHNFIPDNAQTNFLLLYIKLVMRTLSTIFHVTYIKQYSFFKLINQMYHSIYFGNIEPVQWTASFCSSPVWRRNCLVCIKAGLWRKNYSSIALVSVWTHLDNLLELVMSVVLYILDYNILCGPSMTSSTRNF